MQKAEVYTGYPANLSGSPSWYDGCQIYAPLLSFSFLILAIILSFKINAAFFLYGRFKHELNL